jgi:hypothetical protein
MSHISSLNSTLSLSAVNFERRKYRQEDNIKQISKRLEVFMEMKIYNLILWVVTAWSHVGSWLREGRKCYISKFLWNVDGVATQKITVCGIKRTIRRCSAVSVPEVLGPSVRKFSRSMPNVQTRLWVWPKREEIIWTKLSNEFHS